MNLIQHQIMVEESTILLTQLLQIYSLLSDYADHLQTIITGFNG